MDNFDPYNVLLAIATNISVLLMTAFVLQRHIYGIENMENDTLLMQCSWIEKILVLK